MRGFILLADAAVTAENLSIFNPASPPAESIRSLFILVLAVTAAIFLIVEGVLLDSIIRFGRSPPGGKEPPQVYGSMPIEIAWTVAPLLIVFLLALILTRAEFEVRVDPNTPPAGSKPLYVTVIGHQWWWEYIYEKYDGQDLGIITANELHVPASEDSVARSVYLAGALILGIGFLAYAVGLSLRRSTERARGVLQASLIYLPALLTLWLLDGIPHG
jgi:cytochrome c oxidase subunit 2